MDQISQICKNILEPIRENYGIPFTPNSGYRSPKLNNAVGSSPKSQHLKGQAVDMQFKGVNKKDYFDIAEKIAENINFDKVLLEYKDTGSGLPWIHISFKVDQPRKLMFTYFNHRKTHNQFVDLA